MTSRLGQLAHHIRAQHDMTQHLFRRAQCPVSFPCGDESATPTLTQPIDNISASVFALLLLLKPCLTVITNNNVQLLCLRYCFAQPCLTVKIDITKDTLCNVPTLCPTLQKAHTGPLKFKALGDSALTSWAVRLYH